MATIIKDENLIRIPGSIRPDTKRRVVLPSSVMMGEDIIYHIYSNSDGQIILDPQVTIPASEAWLFKNPDILALAQRGLSDAAEGKVSRIDLDTL